MKHIAIPLIMGAMLLLTGCEMNDNQQQLQAISAMSTPFAAGAIMVNLRAEPTLNTVNDMPNSCTVLIIQMQDPAALDQLLNNPVALRTLFSSGVPADNVLKIDRYVMMPGQTATLHIDRAYNARQVALVAGYYPSPGKAHTLSVPVPVVSWDDGWFRSNWQAELGQLTITVVLGQESIISADYPRTESAKKQSNKPAKKDSLLDFTMEGKNDAG